MHLNTLHFSADIYVGGAGYFFSNSCESERKSNEDISPRTRNSKSYLKI